MRRFAGWVLLVLFSLEAVALAAYLLLSEPREPWVILVALVMGLAQGLVVVAHFRIAGRVLRPEHAPAHVERRADPRPPVKPVSDDALAALPEPVTACPECAYIGIRMPELRDGAWPPGSTIAARVVCPRCGYQGLPASFERREDYGAFLRELARAS